MALRHVDIALAHRLAALLAKNRSATGSSLRTFEKIIPPPGYRKRSLGLRHTASPELASCVRLARTNPYRTAKFFAYLRIYKLGVLDFCLILVLSLQLNFRKGMLKNIRCSYTLHKKKFVTLQTKQLQILKMTE